MASVRTSNSYTVIGDQTIATVTAGDTFVFMGCASDGDPVHRAIDSAPTLGGTALTAATGTGIVSAGGQSNQVDIWYLKNVAGGTNVTLHTNYHTSPAAFMGAWFLIQSADTTTQPAANGSDTQTGGTAPSISLTSLTTSDLILEVISSSATPSVNSSQTSDFTGSGNGSSFAFSHKTATTGTNAESWSQVSAGYAYAAVAIKGAGGGGGTVTISNLGLLGVG